MGLITKVKQLVAKKYYPWRIRKKAAKCGAGLYCGGKSWVTSNTFPFWSWLSDYNIIS